ncbi:MAG: hypothetical protein M3094_04000 [Actinomycetia bacterium]|nr:hypothetical protein [Actinomycetes bacterium]
MTIVVFILIAGLWAAFVIPSFFDHRNNAPRSTTREFARTRSKLAQVSMAQPDSEVYVRRHSQRRRQRILIGLGIASVSTLAVATMTGSVPWLWLNIAINVSIAAFVTILLTLKAQQTMPRAQVVDITAQAVARHPVPQPIDLAEQPYEESKTVRVING